MTVGGKGYHRPSKTQFNGSRNFESLKNVSNNNNM